MDVSPVLTDVSQCLVFRLKLANKLPCRYQCHELPRLQKLKRVMFFSGTPYHPFCCQILQLMVKDLAVFPETSAKIHPTTPWVAQKDWCLIIKMEPCGCFMMFAVFCVFLVVCSFNTDMFVLSRTAMARGPIRIIWIMLVFLNGSRTWIKALEWMSWGKSIMQEMIYQHLTPRHQSTENTDSHLGPSAYRTPFNFQMPPDPSWRRRRGGSFLYQQRHHSAYKDSA